MSRYLLLMFGISLLAACNSTTEQTGGWENTPLVVLPDSLPQLDSLPKPNELAGYTWAQGQRKIVEQNCNDIECSNISWQWFTLATAPSPALIDSVSKFNWYYLTGIPGVREQDLDSIAASFFREAKREIPPGEQMNGWYEDNYTWPAAATAQTFTVGGSVTFFNGGAHGNSASHLENFDATTGNRLTLREVVEQPFNLFIIGEQVFRKAKAIDPSKSLNEGGYSFKEDVFYLPESFGILPEGLLFIYAPYEIGSHAQGEQYLLIPYSVMGRELRQEFQYLAQ